MGKFFKITRFKVLITIILFIFCYLSVRQLSIVPCCPHGTMVLNDEDPCPTPHYCSLADCAYNERNVSDFTLACDSQPSFISYIFGLSVVVSYIIGCLLVYIFNTIKSKPGPGHRNKTQLKP